jgi:hypothetical protein
MAHCAHQDVSFLVRAVHSRQTGLPLGKSALASLGYFSRKRGFPFLVVLRSEFCSQAELPSCSGRRSGGRWWNRKGQTRLINARPEMLVGHHREEYWNRPLRTAKVNVVE